MIVSLFIDNKICHIYAYNVSCMYLVSDKQKISDKVVLLIKNYINIYNVSEIIFSTGPTSFTSTRIIYSIIKSIKLIRPEINFCGISSFLTYLNLINNKTDNDSNNGNIAIPTLKGDYFFCNYKDNILSQIKIGRLDEISSEITIFIEKLQIHTNLAQQQFLTYISSLPKINKSFITYDTNPIYYMTPVFKKTFSKSNDL